MKISDIGKTVKKVLDPQTFGMTKKIRIAVLGSKYAGKTVLLSALDKYLQRLEETSEKLNRKGECAKESNGWQLAKLQDISAKRRGEWSIFAKKEYQRKMAECNWPERTSIPAVLAYKLEFAKEGKFRRYEIELLDIPGERVADVVTMWNKSYEGWSDEALKQYKKTESDWYHGYLEKVAESKGDRDFILLAYKEFVAKHLSNLSFFVTPSEAMLDRKGTSIDERGLTVEYDDKDLLSRMNDIKFAPVPYEFRGNKEFMTCVKDFRKEYRKYKKESQVDGIKGWCETSDQVYYLVDVLGALERGDAGYKSTREQVRLATVGVADRSLFRRIFSSNLSKFYAVATQGDRSALDEDAEERIKEWLDEYFSKTEVFRRGVFGKVIVAAVSSMQKIQKAEEGGVIKEEYEGRKGFMKDPNKSFSEENRLISKKPYKPMPVPSVAEAQKRNFKGYSWERPFPYFPEDGNFANYNLDRIVASILELD